MNEAQLVEAQEELRIFKELVATEGWQRLVEIMQTQNAGREQKLREPLPNIFALPEAEYIKGELSGAMNVLLLPARIIEQAEVVIAEIKHKREIEEEYNDAGRNYPGDEGRAP